MRIMVWLGGRVQEAEVGDKLSYLVSRVVELHGGRHAGDDMDQKSDAHCG